MTEGAPRWAKLELLIRADDESFEVREVPSSAAWLGMRPQRPEAGAWELAELSSRVDRQRRFVLKNTRTERFLMLSEPERFLWDRMDGQTSLQDLATAYVLQYGAFDFDLIPGLIGKLQRAELLTFQPSSALRRALARKRGWRAVHALERGLTTLEHVTVSSRRVQPLFERLYRAGGCLLFTRTALLACLSLGVVGAVAGVWLWRDLDDVARGLGARPLAAIVVVKLCFLATLALHQVVHALACVHYGRRVREFGFTFLHGFVPTFYVDVTDIFMASRRARIVTALAGTLVHLVLGALWFVLAATSPPGFVQAFAAASGMIQWQAFVIALYPCCFIEMDGYHILVDVLGAPTLKHDAIAYVGSLLRGAPAAPWGRPARLWVAYVAISTVSVALFFAFNVWVVMRAI
ncbi:MAG: M50 family metallopeptidase [Candidatus Rokuibacteriota bacterium]